MISLKQQRTKKQAYKILCRGLNVGWQTAGFDNEIQKLLDEAYINGLERSKVHIRSEDNPSFCIDDINEELKQLRKLRRK